MKKIVILSCLGFSLFAAGDYVPLSELSDDEKVGYNFTDKKDIVTPVESKNYTSVSKKNNEIIQPVENNKIKEKILFTPVSSKKTLIPTYIFIYILHISK